MDYLKDLNAQQQEAVTAPPGQILVLAGPGSGKTRVLTHRILYIIQKLGIPSYNILAVTFTNKAANEMKNRINHMLGSQRNDIWLGTFHAICARILRREAGHLPFQPNFVIYDEDDQHAALREVYNQLNLDEKQPRIFSVKQAISAAKNNLILPEDVTINQYRDERFRKIYQHYQQLLVNNNALDFDDLLLWTVRLLADHQEIRESYSRRFHHILVDEFQDTNFVQYELLKLLSYYHKNIFVVGDEDQSIYRWRGADYRNILRFEDDFPEAQKILLEINYRSTQRVLDAARSVIDHNPNRTPKFLSSARGITGDPIVIHEAPDDLSEAIYVVDTIRKLISSGNSKGNHFAIMYRTNAQSRLYEEAFLRAGMNYRLVGAQRFYGRREIKDMIAYLRLIYNPADEVSLSRIINVPKRGIGDKTYQNLLDVAHQYHIPATDILKDLGQNEEQSPFWQSFPNRSAQILAKFGSLYAGWCDIREFLSLPDLFSRVVEDIDYVGYIEDDQKSKEDEIDRRGNLEEFRRLTNEYSEIGLAGFLENLALVSDQDTIPEALDAPTLLTLHAAKGLEFPIVFIVGVDDGLIPHSRAFDEPEEMEEERRLFYVGITRAKNRLFLTRAERRSTYGSFDYTTPSRFLKDIPEKLFQRSGRPSYVWSKSHDYQPSKFKPEKWKAATGIASENISRQQPLKYRSGMRVFHGSWGEGIVIESRIRDDEETVDVIFDSVGLKRLLASLARLEILE